jgi:hypothetical protein
MVDRRMAHHHMEVLQVDLVVVKDQAHQQIQSRQQEYLVKEILEEPMVRLVVVEQEAQAGVIHHAQQLWDMREPEVLEFLLQ